MTRLTSFHLCCGLVLRATLLESGHFGGLHLEMQTRLDEAYTRFRAFCRSEKILNSQPPFTIKMAARLIKWLHGWGVLSVCL